MRNKDKMIDKLEDIVTESPREEITSNLQHNNNCSQESVTKKARKMNAVSRNHDPF